jgi:hypothetical protein
MNFCFTIGTRIFFPFRHFLCCWICRFVLPVLRCSMCSVRLFKTNMLFRVSSRSVNFFVIPVLEFLLCSFRRVPTLYFSCDVLFHAFLCCVTCPASFWIHYVVYVSSYFMSSCVTSCTVPFRKLRFTVLLTYYSCA